LKIEKEEYLKYLGLFVVYLFALFVVFLRPLDVQDYQWADDALYFNNAISIISNIGGEYWLGPFNKAVISKAPFFSVFLAGIHYIGIPLRFAEFLLFTPLPFLFWRAIRPLQIGKWKVIYSAALCLVCIPVAGTDTRLLRTALFGALSLYCMISLAGVVTRSWNGSARVWPWAVSAGLFLGLAATTREDASWLMVPAGIVISISLSRARNLRKSFYYGLIVLFIVGSYFLPVTLFSALNYKSYGVYSPSLRQNSTFRDFYAILCSLQPDQRRKYVPIITNTREAAYAISPHFAQLRPFLEGPALDYMAHNQSHLFLNMWDKEGREYFVSNFEFALTDAIILSGCYTGHTLLRFSRLATKEINKAISRGMIEHGRRGFSMLPPVELSDAGDMLAATIKSFWLLWTGEGQSRDPSIQTTPLSPKAVIWHKFLKTYPYPPSGSEPFSMKLRNRIFNGEVALLRIGYSFFLLLGFVSGVSAYINKGYNYPVILGMLALGWSSLLAFCMTIAVVDTIGFRILEWPMGYNIVGYFPMHFLGLISVMAFFGTSGAGIFRKLPGHPMPAPDKLPGSE